MLRCSVLYMNVYHRLEQVLLHSFVTLQSTFVSVNLFYSEELRNNSELWVHVPVDAISLLTAKGAMIGSGIFVAEGLPTLRFTTTVLIATTSTFLFVAREAAIIIENGSM